jgi:hypothetical protein
LIYGSHFSLGGGYLWVKREIHVFLFEFLEWYWQGIYSLI